MLHSDGADAALSSATEDFALLNGRYSEAEQQQDALIGWRQEYSQLGSGAYEGFVQTLKLGGIRVQREFFNVAIEQRTAAPAGTVNFAWMSTDWRVDGSRFGPRSVSVWTGGDEHLAVNCGGSDTLLVTVDANLVGAGGETVWMAEVPLSSAGVSETGTWLSGILAVAAADRGFGRDEFLSVLPSLILDRLSAIAAPLLRRRADPREAPRVFRSVRELVNEHPGEPLTVMELCGQLGVSREALHHAFLDAVGMTPSAWLRNRRLNGAHRDLRCARRTGETVSSIAMKWGFWHLGRFSSYYHDLFGRYPSEAS